MLGKDFSTYLSITDTNTKVCDIDKQKSFKLCVVLAFCCWLGWANTRTQPGLPACLPGGLLVPMTLITI